jgi:hypothetical protein
MIEQWQQWKPIKNLVQKYHIDSIHDTDSEFKVRLSSSRGPAQTIEIDFGHGVESYTRTNESFKLTLIRDLDEEYGADFYGDWTFFIVINSEYIRMLDVQSGGWSNSRDFIHYSLLASDSILDILCTTDPIVRIIE